MLNEVARSGNLLNPCSYLKGRRQEEYTDALNNSYGPGSGQMLITLPVDTTLDLSSATLDFDLSFINETDEVPLIIDIVKVGSTVPASGHFQIEYDGDVSGEIAFDATAADIATVLNNMHPINGRFFTVSTSGGPLPTAVRITIGGFNHDNQKVDDISAFAIVNNFMSDNATPITGPLSGVPVQYSFNYVQNSAFSYPRAEKFFCPFSKISVVVNNKNVVDIQDFDILYNISQLGRHTYSRWSDYLLTSANDEGQGLLPGQEVLRMQIDLSMIDLFKQLMPLNIFKGIKITLQATLQQATSCLIINGSTVDNNNPFNQSYQIANLRLHYYSVEMHESDLKAIEDVYNSSGVAIPFLNYATFTDSVNQGESDKNINFSPQASNVLGAYAIFSSNGYANLASNLRKRSIFLSNDLESYRMKLGSYFFPEDTTKCSNIFFYSTDIVQAYVNLTEIIQRRSNQLDYLGLETFLYNITDPTVRIYSTEQQRLIGINSILSILTCDTGHDSSHEVCQMGYLQGVDTSNSSSNYLQVKGMTVQSAQTCFIYVVTQDSLVFKPGKMVWNH